jgi:hypothetical protein
VEQLLISEPKNAKHYSISSASLQTVMDCGGIATGMQRITAGFNHQLIVLINEHYANVEFSPETYSRGG